MSVQHYVGYYFKCNNTLNEINPMEIFEDESFIRVFDEGGDEEINNSFIFIPNKTIPSCFHLSHYDKTGLLDSSNEANIPDAIEEAGDILNNHYKYVELRYGIVAYAN